MYNFFVAGQVDAWKGKYFELERSRFLEFTSDNISASFRELKTPQIEALIGLPCLFAYEGTTKAVHVGWLVSIRKRERVLVIEFTIDKGIRPISFKKIEPLQAVLDIRRWEMNRTHWAVKDEDLLSVLRSADLIPATPPTSNAVKGGLPPVSEPDLRADTVGDFISMVLDLAYGKKEVFYRGHSNRAKYRLEPSLFRKDAHGNFNYLDAEDKMYRELLVSNSADFQGDIYTLDRLVRMQHYSLPTRLLDITSNPLIALYFACKSNPGETGEVIVLALDRSQIGYFDSDKASCIANLARLPIEDKNSIDYTITGITPFNRQPAIKRLIHFVKEEKSFFEPRIDPLHLRTVICVKGKHTNNRISFQSGAFLLFGQDAVLDENGTDEIEVKRIAISDKRRVLRQLDRLNINESTVFPYIENSAKYVAQKFSFHA